MNKNWFKAAGVRAIKTMAETAVGMIGTMVFIEEINWLGVLSASAVSGILSILLSIKGLPEVDLANEDYLEVNNQQAVRINDGEFTDVDYTKEDEDEEVETDV